MASEKLKAAISALSQPTTEAGKNPSISSDSNPPKGYKPLSINQKNEWNGFLKYLYQNKYSGNKDLDTGEDKTAQLIDMYKKVNPSFSITPQMVPIVQYEISQLQQGKIPDKNGKLVNVMDNGFGKAIPSIYYGRQVSPVDGRIGSLTSAEPFPIQISKDLNKNWGTDYWSYIKDMNQFMKKTGSHFANDQSSAAKTAMNFKK